MKKVLLTISILMLIMGGYGETKTVYADDWSTSIPDIDVTEGYTVYGSPEYDLYSAQYSNSQGTQAIALARFKYQYAGRMTDYTYDSGKMTEITTTIWNLYIETYALGDSLSTTTNENGTSKLKIIADNNVFSSLSIACRSKNWGGGSQTVVTTSQYVGVGGNGYEILNNINQENTEMGSPKYTTIPISSDYNLKRLKTSKSIVIQIDENINNYYVGTFYVKSRTVQRDANGNVLKWTFLMPGIDVDGNNPDQGTIYYSMQNDVDPLYITYLKKGSEVYMNGQLVDDGGSGGGGSVDVTNPVTPEQEEQLTEQNEKLTNAQEQVADYEELEQQLVADNSETLDNVDFTSSSAIFSMQSFALTANWVKARYTEMIGGSPFESVLLLSLAIGFALYVIGRMR